MTPDLTRRCTVGPAAIDAFHWDIVAFVLSWAPYGGPGDEESLPCFGMTAAQLQARFADVISKLGASPPPNLSDPQRELVKQGQQLLASRTVVSAPTTSRDRSTQPTTDPAAAKGRRALRRGVWHWTTD